MRGSAGAARAASGPRGYDRLPQRRWLFVPLWGIPTFFCYAPRRVTCAGHGVVVEHIPWSTQTSDHLRHDGIPARWARRLSRRETARRPNQLGGGVSVGGMVCTVGPGSPPTMRCGIDRGGRDSLGTRAKGRQLLDRRLSNRHMQCRVALGRPAAFPSHVAAGPEVPGAESRQRAAFCVQRHGKPYLQIIAAQAGQALHVLDRFHITSHLNQAGSGASAQHTPRGKNQAAAQRLKHMRWPLLRRESRVRGRARQKLNDLLASKLATARAWELKETFSHSWHCKSLLWAEGFLIVGVPVPCAAASNR